MSFEKKKEAALEELGRSKIWRSNATPPAIQLCWKLGFKIKPPHYNSFLANALITGIPFGIFWGCLMWFFIWENTFINLAIAIPLSLSAGASFGVTMALYYAWSAKKNRLTRWDGLPTK